VILAFFTLTFAQIFFVFISGYLKIKVIIVPKHFERLRDKEEVPNHENRKSITTSEADGSRVSTISPFTSSSLGLTRNSEQNYKSPALIYTFTIGYRQTQQMPTRSITRSLCAN
jgi:hypothetical protein